MPINFGFAEVYFLVLDLAVLLWLPMIEVTRPTLECKDPNPIHWSLILCLLKGLLPTLGAWTPGIRTGKRVGEYRHPITATLHTQWAQVGS